MTRPTPLEPGGPWGGPWADEDHPHEEDVSRAQIDGLLERLAASAGAGRSARRILDLGCGAGRVLVPLAVAGHAMTGVDRDASALARCRAGLDAATVDGRLLEQDFLAELPGGGETFDAVLCLGNTIMTVADVDRAVDLMRAVAARLAPDGVFIVDDCPRDLWPELTEGNWQTGVSADGAGQMVWAESDAVFAFRRGDDVDTDRWTIVPGDRPLRLWSDGALRLAARAAGLSAPERLDVAHLLVMRASR